jgi:hypothetical protein
MSHTTVRTADFVGRFQIVREEILTVVYEDEGHLGCKCSKGTDVSEKIGPPSSV